jgi:hypothetical protein
MLQSPCPSDLSAIDNVAPGYTHRDKLIEPGEGLALTGAWLKWYDIALPEMPVPAEIRNLARAAVMREAAGGKMDLAGELGFVILHRCSAEFYFLLVCSWRHENEIWKSTFARDAGDPDFKEFTFATPHRGTYCVWELGAVWHEQQAWKRYLRSARDDAAKLAYLGDSYRGEV